MKNYFKHDAEVWHESRKPFISQKTFREYRLNIKTLGRFFGEMSLREITPQHIRDYQLMRMKECGPPAINHETGVLQLILRRHKLWNRFEDDYQKLPVSKEIRGRILTPEEYDRLAALNLDHPMWLLAMISINTTAGPKELLTLRRRDVDMENNLFSVQKEGAKNPFRMRTIPLNKSAYAAMQRVLIIAAERGCTAPEHYIFPFRVKTNHWDATRHARADGRSHAWSKITKLAGIKNFRLYDLRHHAITSLLSDPLVSDETVEQIAGHVSKEMKKRYSHIQIQTKRSALDNFDNLRSAPNPDGVLTNSDVIELLKHLPPEVVKAKIAISMTACAFDISIEAIKELTLAGVPKEVIVTMMLVPAQNVSAPPLEAMQWTRLRTSTRNNRAAVKTTVSAPSGPEQPKLYLRTAAYDREKLSKEVWERPLVQIAPEYGLSDVALGKLCKRLNIPLPGRGYWEKKRADSVRANVPVKTDSCS